MTCNGYDFSSDQEMQTGPVAMGGPGGSFDCSSHTDLTLRRSINKRIQLRLHPGVKVKDTRCVDQREKNVFSTSGGDGKRLLNDREHDGEIL